ncbi:UNVERIFIED_CONTAM: hypothetical protein Slati_2125800 [Sesamum latifolium]|uniref:Reverse transcriptase n=1 Tax=Sesamum latifolium TaxID=2727402 RepID=A0AAW2WTJ2_9LAMI
MGMRNLKEFNINLLSKYAWRILTITNSLVYRLYKARYFSGMMLEQARGKGFISYAWRSILAAKPLLQTGCRWRIGDGSSIKITTTPWLLRPTTFQLGMLPQSLGADATVNVLLDDDGEWNEKMIRSEFDSLDVEWILLTPTHTGEADRLLWHYDKKRRFSVCSTYWLATHTERTTTLSRCDMGPLEMPGALSGGQRLLLKFFSSHGNATTLPLLRSVILDIDEWWWMECVRSVGQ